jgi:adenosylcobinamide amidohydrolase
VTTRFAAAPRTVSEAGLGASALVLECSKPWLRVRFAAPHRTLGWTIVGGGFRSSDAVSWLHVSGEELAPPVDPRVFVRERLAAAGRSDEPVFLTGCALDEHVVAEVTAGEASATCVATIGLGNALRIGDPTRVGPPVDTINVLCAVSLPLDDLALLEALALAVEARTTAMLEAGVASRVSGLAATGTGTDCVVLAVPQGADAAGNGSGHITAGGFVAAQGHDQGGTPRAYAGKHTAVGAAIGGAVLAAVARGVAEWRARYGG